MENTKKEHTCVNVTALSIGGCHRKKEKRKKETDRRKTSATCDVNTRTTTSQFCGFSPNSLAEYFHGQEQGRVPSVAIGLIIPVWALPKRSANALSRAAAAV